MTVTRSALLAFLALSPLLAGCNVWQQRAEFAPPESRWPANLPSPAAADAPPTPQRTVHCYRTLASVDCFPQKQPGRTGYTGAYPADN